MKNTLSAKEPAKEAAQIFFKNRVERCRGIKDVNTFSVSHSKHIHQPATFPRINYKKKNVFFFYCDSDKTQAFSFFGLTQFSTERRRRRCYAIWSLPNPKAWLFLNVGAGALSENPAGDRSVGFSPPHRCAVVLIINSSSFFLRSLKAPLLPARPAPSPARRKNNKIRTRGVTEGV